MNDLSKAVETHLGAVQRRIRFFDILLTIRNQSFKTTLLKLEDFAEKVVFPLLVLSINWRVLSLCLHVLSGGSSMIWAESPGARFI